MYCMIDYTIRIESRGQITKYDKILYPRARLADTPNESAGSWKEVSSVYLERERRLTTDGPSTNSAAEN